MSANYRTHLEDKISHTLRTTLWQLYSAPSAQTPIKQIVYATIRADGTRVYRVTGYDHPITIDVVPDSAMHDLVKHLIAAPNVKALDLFVATLEATS